ncbi:MAG: DEAD/DEAH box helicase [Armatimonadota bacterium]|nr:DEAD/DEAH box helicase [bacterium]
MPSCFPAGFHPAIEKWFVEKFGQPTQPQKLGWPLIDRGINTLILAPTGSGKTLAAFLAGINRVILDLVSGQNTEGGVEILYISPLKALNYDIERNLASPLLEINKTAKAIDYQIPEITTAVRTGDTPANERRKMLKKPPHILITTPESLHIMLTSSARKILETVRYVIVDEIHALCPNKRGVFLSVLLERLENVCMNSPVRIGLSATQKPLSEVARFLGGFDNNGEPRHVEIVDTGIRRQVDLKVVCTCEDLRHPEDGSVWPSIYRRLLDLVHSHKSTIIFANTRRIVEKITLGVNDLAGEEIVKPHHGSVSASIRRITETALKDGTLKGVVATGTLELGIDMGAVELVCQVESPKEVSRGLQRVGRAGHVHTAVSKGRVIAKTNPDLVEAVSIAEGMLEGDVEPISVPKNCLDILAQQIVAMAAIEDTNWEDVYRTIKRTYTFRELSEEAFNLTLQLVTGRYPSKAFKDLRARVSLDRVTGRISPLPGSQRLVIANGGAIPDTGEYGVYLADAHVKIGELDEEFVYESREGDTFSLGTNNWKIQKIDADKVIVSHSSPIQARMPFWRGESVPRSARSGRRMGEMLRKIAEMGEDAREWVLENLPVDMRSAANLCDFVKVQTGLTDDSGLPTDKRIVLESFIDELGSTRLALLSVFGGRIHHALRIAFSALMKKELGVIPETVSGDNGILFKLPEGDAQPPFGLFKKLTPELAYELIAEDLPDTALFGLRFRQNAARALLLPGPGVGKRTPLWLQRLKSKDLLHIAKSFDGFPIVVETLRECLQDYLEISELQEILRQVQSGEIELSIVERQLPSPFTSTMLFDFQMIYQYEWDTPKTLSKKRNAPSERRLVDELVDGKVNRMLDERAISDLDNQLQCRGERSRARTAEELYELVRQLGDIPEEDANSRCTEPEMLDALIEEGRLVRVTFSNAKHPDKLVACDYLDEYLQATSNDDQRYLALAGIIERHISNRGVVISSDISPTYGLPIEFVANIVKGIAQQGGLIEIPPAPDTQEPRWVNPDNLEIIYRRTLAMQKLEAKPASPEQYQAFLLKWQHLHPDSKLHGQDGVRTALRQLEATRIPYSVWEPDILARRVGDFRAEHIDNLCNSAEFIWVGESANTKKPGSVAFLAREGLQELYSIIFKDKSNDSASEQRNAIYQALKNRGASFAIDLVLDTGLDSRIVQGVLWEMIWSGDVTHDYFKTLRSGKPPVISPQRHDQFSTKVVDKRQFYRARSRIARTFTNPPSANPGRWVLLSSLCNYNVNEQDSLEIYARILLERYGIVAKELVYRTGEIDIVWNDLYEIYKRMELSGEIERGYFVDGLGGAQFGLPEAVDVLLGRSRVGFISSSADDYPILVNSCDPAYLYSAAGPFDVSSFRMNRLTSNYAVLFGGQPVLTLELGSGTLRMREDTNKDDMPKFVSALTQLINSPWPIRPYRKVEIASFDTQPIINSPIDAVLRSCGFEEENNKLVLRSIS